MQKTTLAAATPQLHGIGLHTGAPGWVRLMPLHPGAGNRSSDLSGIVFKPSASDNYVEASPCLVAETRRCTALRMGHIRLSTTEHLLAALSGCGVTDAVIEFAGPEVPILDGSAKVFAAAIEAAGLEAASAEEVEPITLAEPVIALGKSGERLIALPSDSFSVTVALEYPNHAALGSQAAHYGGGSENFVREIASARTYGFLSEFEQVQRLGLATGASLDNCVALADDGSADPRTPLRFPNEPARHKLLDVIGDLALVGRPILAEIVAVRPSHTVNCLLATRLFAGTQ